MSLIVIEQTVSDRLLRLFARWNRCRPTWFIDGAEIFIFIQHIERCYFVDQIRGNYFFWQLNHELVACWELVCHPSWRTINTNLPLLRFCFNRVSCRELSFMT